MCACVRSIEGCKVSRHVHESGRQERAPVAVDGVQVMSMLPGYPNDTRCSNDHEWGS